MIVCKMSTLYELYTVGKLLWCQIYGGTTGFYKYLLAWVYRNVYKNIVTELLGHINT